MRLCLIQRELFLGLVCMGWVTLLGAAQSDPDAPMSARAPTTSPAFRLRRWTAEDGLPKNTVLSLLQARDGYLWIGTREGLARFDGVRFKVFTEELRIEPHRGRLEEEWPPEFSCLAVVEDTAGRVWVLLPAGLVSYHKGRFEKFSTRSGALRGTISAMSASRRGGLWIGTLADGLRWFADGRYQRTYQVADGLATARVGLVREDLEGRLWVAGGESGIGRSVSWQRLDPLTGKFESWSDVIGEKIENVDNLICDRTGRLWFSTPDALFCWNQGELSRFPGGDGWSDRGTGSMIDARDGALWIRPVFSRGILRFRDGHFERFGVSDGLADTDIRALLSDREGNLWLGMGVGGLQQLRPRALRTWFSTTESGERQPVDSIAPGRPDALWLGAWSGLLYWQGDSLRRFVPALRPGRSGHNARPVLEDRNGKIWFGSEDQGLFTLALDKIVRVAAADDGRSNWTVRVLHEDRRGGLWIGSDSGLLEQRGDRFVRYTARHGLLDDSIVGVRDAPDGSLWVGTREGVHLLRAGRFTVFTTRDGLLSNQAAPLLVEPDGTVWVGTPLGLNRLRRGEVRSITEKQGLNPQALFCLVDDGAGNYWASSVRGFVRMRKADLHAVADGRRERLFCVSYGEADGAAGCEGTEGYQPNACRTPDGQIWFATTHGVVALNPEALIESGVPPLVAVEEVLADDQLIFSDGGQRSPPGSDPPHGEGAAPLRLPAGRAQVLEIRYTANSFVAPEKVHFRYQLEGADRHWRDAGTRRAAFYTNLRPGTYRFLVEASNQEGTWSGKPAEFAFTLAPRFTQTVWFPLSLVVAGIGLSLGFLMWRLHWQKRAFAAEQAAAIAAERGRIARDLHDDLGATLTGFALELEAARRQGRAEGEQLGTLAAEARVLANDVRELAWTTNPRCDNADSLGTFMGELTERFCQAAELKCKLELPEAGDGAAVPAGVRHALLAVLKESLANIAKHAGAGTVVLRLASSNDELRLVVGDDGCGFEPAYLTGGTGLRNLPERLEPMGGSFHVSSQPGRGTTVVARVPLGRRRDI